MLHVAVGQQRQVVHEPHVVCKAHRKRRGAEVQRLTKFRGKPARTLRTCYENSQTQIVLDRSGLSDVESLFLIADGARCRHQGRAVAQIQLAEEHSSTTTAYVKLQWGRRRLWPRIRDLKSGQYLKNQPTREWQGIAALASIGLYVPSRLALFREGLLSFREAVVISAVPPRFSLQDMHRNGAWDDLQPSEQESLLVEMVRVMRRIHRAGLGWRGVCTRHFFPETDADGRWKLWLIDCEGVHRRRKAWERDDPKLMKSFIHAGFNASIQTRLHGLLESSLARH